MKNLHKFYFLLFNLYYTYGSYQDAYFSLIPKSIYIPQFAVSFLTNITGIGVSDETKCAAKCLNYRVCQTAVYYKDIQVCSLFYEKSSVGYIQTTENQTSIVIAMTVREPKGICIHFKMICIKCFC